MSGFLQRLVERTHGAAQAPLRRRRPSLFEGREAAPPAALDDAVPAPPAPVSPDSAPRLVHTREIHHHDVVAEPVARRATRGERVAIPAPKPVAPQTSLLLPTPPALRPLPVAPPQTSAPMPRMSPQAGTAPVARRARPQPEPTLPAVATPRKRIAPEASDAPTPRRTRPAPTTTAGTATSAQTLPLPPRLAVSQRAAAPVAHPARRAGLPAPAASPVQVSIGSVEIRAQPTAPAPERARPRSAQSPQVPSLDAYLRERHGGPR